MPKTILCFSETQAVKVKLRIQVHLASKEKCTKQATQAHKPDILEVLRSTGSLSCSPPARSGMLRYAKVVHTTWHHCSTRTGQKSCLFLYLRPISSCHPVTVCSPTPKVLQKCEANRGYIVFACCFFFFQLIPNGSSQLESGRSSQLWTHVSGQCFGDSSHAFTACGHIDCVESGTIQARHRTPCSITVPSVYLQQCSKAKVL